MNKLRVGVLRGGPSHEYEVSLQSGARVLANLPEQYEPIDIFISREADWHLHGLQKPAHRVLLQLDLVFNAMHGEYGEDGEVQRLLEAFALPYTGSRPYNSMLAMHKPFAKRRFREHGLAVPKGEWLNTDNPEHEANFPTVLSEFPLPAIVKPACRGSSVGVTFADSRAMLMQAVEKAMRFGKSIMIEEYIQGRNVTCGVIENFRNKKYYALPPEEIILCQNSNIFDYDAKYSGKTREICPANLGIPVKRRVEEMAIKAHLALGLRHYSRSDFIITGNNEIYLLETNSLPGLTAVSHIPRELEVVGSNLQEFIAHVINLALERE
jgi:D-alanine-D-alanine ligase